MKENFQAEVEALIFSAEEPVSIGELSRMLEISKTEIRKIINDISDDLKEDRHGYFLKKYNSGYMFVTKPEYADLIRDMYNRKVTHLSAAALETLAIIAYKQPITRAEIEEIRGVKAEKTLLTLGKYSLIEEIGRKDTIGNPIVYGTTDNFLQQFDLDDLSKLPEISMDELDIPMKEIENDEFIKDMEVENDSIEELGEKLEDDNLYLRNNEEEDEFIEESKIN